MWAKSSISVIVGSAIETSAVGIALQQVLDQRAAQRAPVARAGSRARVRRGAAAAAPRAEAAAEVLALGSQPDGQPRAQRVERHAGGRLDEQAVARRIGAPGRVSSTCGAGSAPARPRRSPRPCVPPGAGSSVQSAGSASCGRRRLVEPHVHDARRAGDARLRGAQPVDARSGVERALRPRRRRADGRSSSASALKRHLHARAVVRAAAAGRSPRRTASTRRSARP